MILVFGQFDGDVGCFGYGFGMQLIEMLLIIGFDNIVLRENMVLILEFGIDLGEVKMMVYEENIVICDGVLDFFSYLVDFEILVIF